MGADFGEVIQDIKKRLKVVPLVVQDIIMKDEEILAIIDLVEMCRYEWVDDLGDTVRVIGIEEGDEEYEDAIKKREELLESLADFDDGIMEKVLEGGDITPIEIKEALRKALINHPQECSIVMCGR